MFSLMNDDTKLFKKFMDDPDFQNWLTEAVFELACDRVGAT